MISVPPARAARRSPFFTDLRLGWREFRSHTWLWLLTAQGAVSSLLVMPPMWVLGAVVAKASLGGAGAWGRFWPPSGRAWWLAG